jgi:hypothetical protein
VNGFQNIYQRRSLEITLRLFEEELREAETCLQVSQVNGILYKRKLSLPLEQRQAAQLKITAALEQIASLARKLVLEPEVQDLARLIRSQMSRNWANLLDVQSDKLNRYGDVDPGLTTVIDPAIHNLSQLALELASIFDVQNETFE